MWSGKRATVAHQTGENMSRPAMLLIVLALLIAGGAILLSMNAREVPSKPIEVDVQS
jgi:hypothetical protein